MALSIPTSRLGNSQTDEYGKKYNYWAGNATVKNLSPSRQNDIIPISERG
uniref:Uncharacterized protein n=1 Tax=Utricularia reniformis TaxID=192314 RepID=A0A1Y0AZX9_9LAMI|nr:hypothetical protein AEK19_MT0431 [Utricularia reniformis]ART30694.1 hypothetical protein AEK19_MT0431 [Utricularia reniformis]